MQGYGAKQDIQSYLAIPGGQNPKNPPGTPSDPRQQKFCREIILDSQHFIGESEVSVLSSSEIARFDCTGMKDCVQEGTEEIDFSLPSP